MPKAVMTFLLHMDRPSIDKKPPYPLTVTRPLTKPKNSLFKQKDRYIDKSNNENHSRSQSMISLCRCFQTSEFNETFSCYIYCNNPSFLEDIMVSRRTDSTSYPYLPLHSNIPRSRVPNLHRQVSNKLDRY